MFAKYQLTNYPIIYKHTYWGSEFVQDLNEDTSLCKILNNRNTFVRDHAIKQICLYPPRYVQSYITSVHGMYLEYLDQLEFYISDSHYIILTSVDRSLDVEDLIMRLGFIHTNPLYNLHMNSYILYVPKIDHSNSHIYELSSL